MGSFFTMPGHFLPFENSNVSKDRMMVLGYRGSQLSLEQIVELCNNLRRGFITQLESFGCKGGVSLWEHFLIKELSKEFSIRLSQGSSVATCRSRLSISAVYQKNPCQRLLYSDTMGFVQEAALIDCLRVKPSIKKNALFSKNDIYILAGLNPADYYGSLPHILDFLDLYKRPAF